MLTFPAQSGLDAILGAPGASQGSPTDMATHARIFYYAQRIGTTIDFSSYSAWLDRHPDHQPPDVLPEEHRPASPTLLPWQQAAPKADLFVDKSSQKTQDSATAASEDEPAYPMAFAEMIRLLQEGKPIPGIREIPNTIAREPVSREKCITLQAANLLKNTTLHSPQSQPAGDLHHGSLGRKQVHRILPRHTMIPML